MDLTPYQPIGAAIVLLCFGGFVALKMVGGAGIYKKRMKMEPLIGTYTFTPRPVSIAMDRASAKRKFVDGLRQMQINQGWSIKSADSGSSKISAVMRWSSAIADASAYSTRSNRVTQLNSVLTLKGQVISEGSQATAQWTYDCVSTNWQFPSEHKHDPKAEDVASETNYAILRALGLIVE